MRGAHVKRNGVRGGAREARGGARFLQLARWRPVRVVQGVLYAKRTARGRFRGSFWQQNAFRSSFLEPIGRQTSFGVVKTLPATPKALSKGIRGLKGSVCRPFCCFNNRISCQTESSDLLAQKSLLRNSFRCQGRLRDYSETRFAASSILRDDGQAVRRPLSCRFSAPAQKGLRLQDTIADKPFTFPAPSFGVCGSQDLLPCCQHAMRLAGPSGFAGRSN